MNAALNRQARREALQKLAAGGATLRYRFWCRASGESCAVGTVMGPEVSQAIMACGLNAAPVTRALQELRIGDTDERFGFTVEELATLQGINDGTLDVSEGAAGHGPDAVKAAAQALLQGMHVVAYPAHEFTPRIDYVIAPNL